MWYLTRNISSNISSSPLISGGSCQYFHRWYKKAPTTIIYYIWDCWFHTFAKTSKQEDMKTYFNPTLLLSCIITELPTFLWLCNDLCYFVPLPVSLKLPYSCAKTCPSTVRALPLLINMDKIHRAPSLLCWLRLDRTRRGESLLFGIGAGLQIWNYWAWCHATLVSHTRVLHVNAYQHALNQYDYTKGFPRRVEERVWKGSIPLLCWWFMCTDKVCLQHAHTWLPACATKTLRVRSTFESNKAPATLSCKPDAIASSRNRCLWHFAFKLSLPVALPHCSQVRCTHVNPFLDVSAPSGTFTRISH